ncbi:AAA family ATPase [Schaalia sp. Marseille-Q2122]|uniref:AAA family ATPase n=1 Tax=Schaalia sp. Marseille-Q2122 TaxID=2736604 RepID=UPI00158B1666|nr:AAA family ATPase [Schaalia sp. Marseille-Q2122]
MTITLTDEFVEALNLLHAGSNMFLTGKAGTGKSTLIRHFMASTSRRVVVAAPTGIAALNVEGYTLHRLFSFPIGTTLEAIRSGEVTPKRYKGLLKVLDTLIIDEASMVRADLFDCVAATLEMYGPSPGQPFGGVQIVLVGDLFQLPPVVKEGAEADYLASLYDTPYFFSSQAYQHAAFPTIHLTTVFRQIGDNRMVELLNSIRDGRMSRTDLATVNARLSPDFVPPRDEFWLTLATTNRIVTARNRKALDALDTPPVSFTAAISGDLDSFDAPTDHELTLKVGAQVMLLNNDPQERWVNGSLGEVIDIDLSDPYEPIVVTRLIDGRIVDVTEHTWDVTRPRRDGSALVHEVVGSFTQMPMKLAWAITIHKSQGQTLDRVIIDLSGGTFATGQLYVALSRCTSLEGVVLTRQVFPRDLKIDHRVKAFVSADTHEDSVAPLCAIENLLVGQGDGYLRPIDIAVAFEDGSTVESLVNPQRDVGTAASSYGLSAADLQIAPTLSEVWPFIQDAIEGCGVVSRGGYATLRVLDTELKRTGIVSGLDSVAEPASPPGALDGAATAADLARATAHTLASAGVPHPPRAFRRIDGYACGYTLSREGVIVPYGDPQAVAALIGAKLEGRRVSEASICILNAFEARYGVRVPYEASNDQLSAAQILKEGVRVCFTGFPIVDGKAVEKEEVEALAREVGLFVQANLTKTRCDVLIAADVTTNSGKAKKALLWGKPMLSVEEFIAWARAHSA